MLASNQILDNRRTCDSPLTLTLSPSDGEREISSRYGCYLNFVTSRTIRQSSVQQHLWDLSGFARASGRDEHEAVARPQRAENLRMNFPNGKRLGRKEHGARLL